LKNEANTAIRANHKANHLTLATGYTCARLHDWGWKQVAMFLTLYTSGASVFWLLSFYFLFTALACLKNILFELY